MPITLSIGGWTKRTTAIALGAVVALAGAVGTTLALNPTVSVPIQWSGGWESGEIALTSGLHSVYVVPAGLNLMMTDIIATNLSSTDPVTFSLYNGVPATCDNASRPRMMPIAVPNRNTLHIPLQTGFGFPAGTRVCLGVTGNLGIHARGFLFKPAS